MEGSSPLKIEVAGRKVRGLRAFGPSPGLLLFPAGWHPEEVYLTLAQKLWLENWSVFWTFERFTGHENLLFEFLWSLLEETSPRPILWVWGEGPGIVPALKLALEFPQISGVILDTFLAEQREEIKGYLSQLRKPHLILHPQEDPSLTFTEAEKMFMLSPAHAKKFLLVPGARAGETLVKGGDLYIHTLLDFIHPRIRRWKRVKKTSH